jgi:thiol-disulfide isomerase/thioredoxin/mono/diheme cytochrome c family protein
MRGHFALSLFLLAPCLFAADTKSTPKATNVKIGSRVGNLTFKDIHYLPRSLDDFPKAKVFVVAFTSTSCPLVQQYLPVLKDLDKEFQGKDVQFLAVNEGADDSIIDVASQAVQHDVPFPFVKDFDGSCAAVLGVGRTAEVVVLDKARTIRYRGRIDDQYRLGGARAKPTRRDLAEAIGSVLAGKDVAVAETTVDGCAITRVQSAAAPQTTYAHDVAPVLRKHCVECHRPGTTAPFSLLTYAEAKAHSAEIAEVVSEGRMPPWFASDQFGHFTNRRVLSSAEKDAVANWLRGGLELGDASQLPKEPTIKADAKPEDRWLIGKPDFVLSTAKTDLPASGLIDYKYVVLPQAFLSDTWLQGIQILPDNVKAVHHCNMAYFFPLAKKKESHFITGTVPGGSPMQLKDGVGFCIPKGAMLVLQIHYVTTGKPEKCGISVGFKYASGLVQKQLRHELMADYKFAIPPGDPAHVVTSKRVLDRDAVGVGLFVHMHLRGRDMTFKAVRPDGTSETLLMVPNFNFDWQIPYLWAPDKERFPKGTRLECVAHYDNSTFNPYNPDPKATVREGQQSHEEMLNGFFFYTDANEKLNLDIDGKTGKPRVKQTTRK